MSMCVSEYMSEYVCERVYEWLLMCVCVCE